MTVLVKKASGLLLDFADVKDLGTKVHELNTTERLLKYFEKGAKLHHESIKTMAMPSEVRQEALMYVNSPLLDAAYHCYNTHLGYTVSPETFWYAIVNQVAVCVKAQPKLFADYFTFSPEKKVEVTVESPNLWYGNPNINWGAEISAFDRALDPLIPGDTRELFIPALSTMTATDGVALLLAFMDAASPFYEYGMRLACGFPRIRVRGTKDDWSLIAARCARFADMFPFLKAYFDDLGPIAEEIASTIGGKTPDDTFWRSMMKVDGGSGGPFVNGWLGALVAFNYSDPRQPRLRRKFDWKHNGNYDGMTLDALPSHASVIPFKWTSNDLVIQMQFAAGVLGSSYEHETITPTLGFAVAEKPQV